MNEQFRKSEYIKSFKKRVGLITAAGTTSYIAWLAGLYFLGHEAVGYEPKKLYHYLV